MRIKDLIEFRSDLYFEGAVQADWVYDKDKAALVSNSFVFHGPKYFGVTSDDIGDSRLLDTASFTKKIYEQLYFTQEETNPFTLAIAGYGTGKSHLAVTLASLFGRIDSTIEKHVISNLRAVANETIFGLDLANKKPNFVIVLNGMKDFNLNYELLKSAQATLKLHCISDDFLKDISEANKICVNFINKQFENCTTQFVNYAKEVNLTFSTKEDLKVKLLENSLEDRCFSIINRVYLDTIGHEIRWDEDVSANKILEKLDFELCHARGKFNKILIIFDEFGRFLEYASSQPKKAGDSALQQIFEAIQNAEKRIQFLGFIQSDLKAYLTRVEKSSNLSRYIGRYEYSERVFLSSNLETIFASLIEKKEPVIFEKLIGTKYENDSHIETYKKIKSWQPTIITKGVWGDFKKYKEVILKGIYPFDPFSTLMLTSMSDWFQNRSALTLINKFIKSSGDFSVDEYSELKTILAVDLLMGDLYNELLEAESSGRQRSAYCTLHEYIIKTKGDKLSENSKVVLLANLIIRLLKFKNTCKDDILESIKFLSGLLPVAIELAIDELENEYGVMQYDDLAKCYDFVGDAKGQGDFRRYFNKKLDDFKFDMNDFDSLCIPISELAGLTREVTSFGKKHKISTNEWDFNVTFTSIRSFSQQKFEQIRKDFLKARRPEIMKGQLYWLYKNAETTAGQLQSVQEKFLEYYSKLPVVGFVLDDSENQLFDTVKAYSLTKILQQDEKSEYKSFLEDFENKKIQQMMDIISSMKKEKRLVIKDSSPVKELLSKFLTDRLDYLYDKIVSFPFDGFDGAAATRTKSKKAFAEIAKKILYAGGSQIDVKTSSGDVRNRFEAVLIHNWRLVNGDTLRLQYPENKSIIQIYSQIDKMINENTEEKLVKIQDIMRKLVFPPYGLNDYSASLVVLAYIASKDIEIRLNYIDKTTNIEAWADYLFDNDKDIDIQKLENTEIKIVNFTEGSNKLENIKRIIRLNKDFMKVDKLKRDFEDILSEINLTREMEDDNILIYDYLKRGEKIFENFNEKLSDLNKKIEKINSDKEYSVSGALEMLNSIENIMKNDYDNYQLTDKQIGFLNAKKDSLIDLIPKKFEDWLKLQKCDEFGKLNSFEKNMQRLSKSLQENGFMDYSRMVLSKKNSVSENAEAIKAKESLNEDLNRLLRTITLDLYTPYYTLNQYSGELDKKLEYLHADKNIDADDKDSFISSIKNYLCRINSLKRDLDSLIEDLIDTTCNVKTPMDLDKCISKINILKQKGYPEKTIVFIDDCGHFIQRIIDFNKEIGKAENMKQLSEAFQNNKEIFISDELDFNLSDLKDSIFKNCQNRISSRIEEWINKYIKIEINSLDESKLHKILQEIEILPSFLDDNAINEGYRTRKLIQEKLSQNKIDYILKLIQSLNDDEKSVIKSSI